MCGTSRPWIGVEVWLPKGIHEFELQRDDAWRVAGMRLVMKEAIGDRGLVARAQARVAARS